MLFHLVTDVGGPGEGSRYVDTKELKAVHPLSLLSLSRGSALPEVHHKLLGLGDV